MNYKEFNDYELLEYIASNDERANEILLYKYRPLIVSIAQKWLSYCSGGVDINDVIQEGLLGLNEATTTFSEHKDANFGTYARICIERKIISLVKTTKRYKNKILNESVALELDQEDFVIDKMLSDNSNNPYFLLESDETQQEIFEQLNNELSDIEKQVFDLKKEDFTYREISEILDKDPKIIDNTIQRIKNKLKKIIADRNL